MRKNCVICEKPILRDGKKGRNISTRSPHAVTCSKNCSRIYTRVFIYISDKLKREAKK